MSRARLVKYKWHRRDGYHQLFIDGKLCGKITDERPQQYPEFWQAWFLLSIDGKMVKCGSASKWQAARRLVENQLKGL